MSDMYEHTTAVNEEYLVVMVWLDQRKHEERECSYQGTTIEEEVASGPSVNNMNNDDPNTGTDK